MRITTAHVEAFSRTGAVFLPGVIDAAFVDLLNRGVERNIEFPSPRFKDFTATGDRHASAIEDHWSWMDIPEYEAFFHSSGIAAVAGELLRCDEIRLLEDQYLQKLPFSGTPTPWHQDQPYYPLKGRWISFWIALDEICAEDALEVVGASHRSGRLYESAPLLRSAAVEMRVLPNADQLPTYGSQPHEWPILRWALKPGDAVAFHPFAIHGNRGNASAARARRFVARFVAEDATFTGHAPACARLIPGHGLTEGDKVQGAAFPLLWRRGAISTGRPRTGSRRLPRRECDR